MRGDELLDKMALIEPAFVEAADVRVVPTRRRSIGWVAVAACLCVAVAVGVGVAAAVRGTRDAEPLLSGDTNVAVTLGADEEAFRDTGAKGSIIDYGDEDIIFSSERLWAFRGTVRDLQNVTIDISGFFGEDGDVEGMNLYRCIATVDVSKVYKGDVTVGESVKVLLPCAIDPDYTNRWYPTYVSHIEVGMEGIFLPWAYEDDARYEENGKVLDWRDFAPCSLVDGNNWAILYDGEYLYYRRSAFESAEGAKTLDDMEAYVLGMLGKTAEATL